MLNTNEQPRIATRTSNGYFSVNIFHSIQRNEYFTVWWWKVFFSSGCDVWTVNYRLRKNLLSAGMDFRRRSARTSEILKVRNEEIRGKMGVNSVEHGTVC